MYFNDADMRIEGKDGVPISNERFHQAGGSSSDPIQISRVVLPPAYHQTLERDGAPEKEGMKVERDRIKLKMKAALKPTTYLDPKKVEETREPPPNERELVQFPASGMLWKQKEINEGGAKLTASVVVQDATIVKSGTALPTTRTDAKKHAAVHSAETRTKKLPLMPKREQTP